MTSFNLVTQRIKDTLLLCDRLQRCTMIENLKFHERLMAAVGMSDGYVFNGISADCYQNMALDILLWISGVQMNDPFKRQEQRLIKYVTVYDSNSQVVTATYRMHSCHKVVLFTFFSIFTEL